MQSWARNDFFQREHFGSKRNAWLHKIFFLPPLPKGVNAWHTSQDRFKVLLIFLDTIVHVRRNSVPTYRVFRNKEWFLRKGENKREAVRCVFVSNDTFLFVTIDSSKNVPFLLRNRLCREKPFCCTLLRMSWFAWQQWMLASSYLFTNFSNCFCVAFKKILCVAVDRFSIFQYPISFPLQYCQPVICRSH